MTDIITTIGLSRLFSSRIKYYFLFLQLTNNTELICLITDFLDIPEILNFLSTSKHIHTFSQIHTIQIKLLKAKVDYYEKPKINPTFQSFINFVQIRAPTAQTKLKTQKMARDHQCLKNFNKQMNLSKGLKKLTNQQLAPNSQKKQINLSRQIGDNLLTARHQKPSTNVSYPNFKANSQRNQQIQKIIKNTLTANQKREQSATINACYQRFQEVEYKLARQDFQRRKLVRLQKQKELQHFITIEELKKIASQDPCVREIIHKIETQQNQKWQKANREKLKMKPIKLAKDKIQKLKTLQGEQKQKMVVVKQSIAQKIFTNIKYLIRKD